MRQRIIILSILIIGFAVTVSADVSPMINYQGKLMQPSGAPVPDGTYNLQFAIYNVPTSGTALWSEVNPNVQVKGGLFAVLLGSISPIGQSDFSDQNRWFGVKVSTDPEMTPRQQIAWSAYAIRSSVAGTVDDGAITTGKLADGTVTTAKLATSAVTGDKMVVASVTSDKIAAGAITGDKIGDGSVSGTKISNSAITLGYAEVSSSFYSTEISSYVDVSGLSVTVSVPPGDRRVKITAFAHFIWDSNANRLESAIFCDGARINETRMTVTAGDAYPLCHIASHVPSAGVHTYKLSLYQSYPGTMWLNAVPSSISFILVELI